MLDSFKGAAVIRSRLARVLLAFFMVPVVVFANPQTASAANQWNQVQIEPSLPGVPDMTCYLNLAYTADGQALNLGANSVCAGSVDISPGQAQWGEQGSDWAVTVSGQQPNGQACGGNGGGTFGSSSDSGVFNVAGTFGSGVIALTATDAGCDVNEVCLFLFPEPGGMDDTQDCVLVDFPYPELDVQSCEYGDAKGINLESQQRPHPTQSGIYQYWWEVKVSLSDASRYDLWRVTKGTTFNSDWATTGITEGGDVLTFPLSMGQVTAANQGQIPSLLNSSKPTGVQVYALDGIRNTGSGYDPSSGSIPTADKYPPVLPDGPYRGLTQSQLCRFYFGQKLVDIPNTDEDEPAGPLVYQPPSTETPDEPLVDPIEVVPEPIDTENSFWSIVGGLLRLILAAIKALGTAIANIAQLILDGLLDLLVPDLGYINSEFRDLQDEWDRTTPARWVTSMEGMIPTGGAGCGGLPLNLTLPGGVQVSESIGAACSGPMANVAGIVRMVLSAGLVIGGTFACVRAIGSGLGWDPGVRADT